jgi:hypothetical protein
MLDNQEKHEGTTIHPWMVYTLWLMMMMMMTTMTT